ncbi:DUF1284 domain-containing protein [Roseospira visakhapatnamensis]|uniref:DUF1284 domain-containing protein n=1 Tax=Roseospira visakhapatnamensis TaxID=390880 RepID=A0A7W6RBF9_9PROT|nr:DUF1284 domain-containing protein [Roseospira visakhapatnamensis]MBB4265272.1 hypothetical protein [Roseospira visakhapatnamensis]
MTVRLRAHHLLCILGYAGNGYSARFVATLDSVVARLSAGEEGLLVEGPDDICGPVVDAEAGDAHCLRRSVLDRDARAAAALSARVGWRVRTGERLVLTRERVERLRAAYAEGAFRDACVDCEWETMCADIAAAGFRDARLRIAD